MGFIFRKSIGRGPFRINLSKRGVGFSVGVRGLRIGRSASGRNTVRASLPGTGVGWQSSSKAKSGCAVPLAIGLSLLGLLGALGAIGVRIASIGA